MLDDRGPEGYGDLVCVGEVVKGMNDEGLFLDMWVYSSFSGGSGALYARISGKDSCKGRSRDVKRKEDDEDDLGIWAEEGDVPGLCIG